MTVDKGSSVRWQSITVQQLGFSVNLLIALAGASLAFALSVVKEPNYSPTLFGKVSMGLSAVLLLASLVLGLLGSVNRLLDFRATAQIARSREDFEKEGKNKDFIDLELKNRRRHAQKLGRRTWWIFYLQSVAFAIGVLGLIFWFAATYREKIF